MSDLQLVIVTGMSGAGKSTTLKYFEDMGFFCVDNLPPTLIPKFAEVCFGESSEIENVALGIDIRGGKLFEELFSSLAAVEGAKYTIRILFLDSSDDVLLKRYKETRRSHPLAKDGRVIDGIAKERELLAEVRNRATYVIDTSQILTRQLKEQLTKIFVENMGFDNLVLTVMSFGFKYGLPADSDLVFDVRFIPNPFYIPSLKPMTGAEKPIVDFVLEHGESREFLDKTMGLLDFLIPNYIKEGKNQLVISVGCTGGRHRSVVLAEEIYSALREKKYSVNIIHRDIAKDK